MGRRGKCSCIPENWTRFETLVEGGLAPEEVQESLYFSPVSTLCSGSCGHGGGPVEKLVELLAGEKMTGGKGG
jgi:hypothetical protein